jgi:hypothetical protein
MNAPFEVSPELWAVLGSLDPNDVMEALEWEVCTSDGLDEGPQTGWTRTVDVDAREFREVQHAQSQACPTWADAVVILDIEDGTVPAREYFTSLAYLVQDTLDAIRDDDESYPAVLERIGAINFDR